MSTLGRLSWILFVAALAVFPFAASRFHLDVANQIFLAVISALGLMLLTGYAGQISLGSAGLLAAGAYTVGVLYQEFGAAFWITLPASAFFFRPLPFAGETPATPTGGTPMLLALAFCGVAASDFTGSSMGVPNRQNASA